MNDQNHLSDKQPETENINVHSLDVYIEIFEISCYVTNLTQKLFLPKMNIQNHVSDKHPQSEIPNVHSLDVLIEIFEV